METVIMKLFPQKNEKRSEKQNNISGKKRGKTPSRRQPQLLKKNGGPKIAKIRGN